MNEHYAFTHIGDCEGAFPARYAEMLRTLEAIPSALPVGTDPFADTGLCADSDLELLSADIRQGRD